MLDRALGRTIWRAAGNVPAANFVRLPRGRSASLGLTGRFAYVQVRARGDSPRPRRRVVQGGARIASQTRGASHLFAWPGSLKAPPNAPTQSQW